MSVVRDTNDKTYVWYLKVDRDDGTGPVIIYGTAKTQEEADLAQRRCELMCRCSPGVATRTRNKIVAGGK
jgi:hypothetical protein